MLMPFASRPVPYLHACSHGPYMAALPSKLVNFVSWIPPCRIFRTPEAIVAPLSTACRYWMVTKRHIEAQKASGKTGYAQLELNPLPDLPASLKL